MPSLPPDGAPGPFAASGTAAVAGTGLRRAASGRARREAGRGVRGCCPLSPAAPVSRRRGCRGQEASPAPARRAEGGARPGPAWLREGDFAPSHVRLCWVKSLSSPRLSQLRGCARPARGRRGCAWRGSACPGARWQVTGAPSGLA